MNIYFSGIGGVGLGPLAEIAHDAGYQVQGSDKEESLITKELAARGIAISNKQRGVFLQTVHSSTPIDWLVYSAALPEDHPELELARQLGIKTTKRDELLAHIIADKKLKLIAITGTHGKTTTTAMTVWAFEQLGIPVSYSIGTTLSFGPSGKYNPASEYFVYECDEFDRNFLHFHPYMSLITSIDYDHPDTYGTPEAYMAAFRQFMDQSETNILWQNDGILVHATEKDGVIVPQDQVAGVKLVGEHNRRNATLVIKALEKLDLPGDHLAALDSYPGTARRFEKLATNLYSDYGHHPVEIAATLQMARELADHVVLVYQPHQNVRQHELRSQYTDCFELADDIYWLPTYLTREDPTLPILTPADLIENVTNPDSFHIIGPDDDLWGSIQKARTDGKLVLVMGAGSIDTWLRDKVTTPQFVNILLVDSEGNFILQRQADNLETGTPGNVTTLGGHVEDDDISLAAAAARILRGKTNLPFTPEDLTYFKTFAKTKEMHGEKSMVTYYTITRVDTKNLEIHDGSGFEIVSPNNLGKFSMPLLDRTVIAEFTHPAM
jgi:UDP-N-acetylmuramate--alanine ligase